MEVYHEIIEFDRDYPIKLFMHKLGDVSRHWHDSVELLLVLAGEVTVLTGSQQHVLQKGGVLLINSNTVHELHAQECVMIAVQIKLSKFPLSEDLLRDLYFDCDSNTAPAAKDFSRLKRLIAGMIQGNAVRDRATVLANRALAYSLLHELVQNFSAEKPVRDPNTRKHLERLNSIIRYINEHYREQLSLNQLAEQEHLSAPYLSSFFEKHMGINFSAYYTNLRLDHAMHDLVYTDVPVEEIALDNGFADARAFVRAFKKKYGVLPSVYRKNTAGGAVRTSKDPLLAINYLDFKPENYLHILTQYMEADQPQTPAARTGSLSVNLGEINCAAPRQVKLQHKWRTFITVGRAKELLYADVQRMLAQLQRDVGFRFLRFHGIFSDDMLVCTRDRDGALHFSFTLIDKALDFVLSVGLRPLIQFSFMPRALAADPDHQVYASPFVISSPARMEEWELLVRRFLEHIRDRYGNGAIRSWLYSVWNEPDTSANMFGFDRPEQYYRLYRHTYRTVKDFDPHLTFGSPSLFPISDESLNWARGYLNFTKEHQCLPEFMDIHYYSDNFASLDHQSANFTTHGALSSDPEHFSKFLSTIRTFLADQLSDQVPLYITEWNLTVSHRNLINDTCFKACYLAKNFLENYDRVDAIGYWSLTDLLEESQLEEELFHGGMGLYTFNGIKKPPCHAMAMLARLGSRLVAAGSGYFVTREDDRFQAILYNYEHCNPLFTAEGFGLTATSRDGVFPLRKHLDISFTLTQLPDRRYRVRETILNQEHGSAFDLWVRMGAQPVSPEEVEWMRNQAAPAVHVYQAPNLPSGLLYAASLAPQEVRLVQFTPLREGHADR